jgi:hypothetical protein
MRTSLRLIATLVVAMAFALPNAVSGAFNGSMDATSGRPGDKITVLSDDTGPFEVGATGLYLMPAIDPNRPQRSINCRREPGSHFLGVFERVDTTARLTFVVPEVRPRAYDVRMDVPLASPSCWRLWPFEVLAALPATDASPALTRPRSSPFVAIVLGVAAGCGLLGLLVWLKARRPGDIRQR